MTGVNRTLYVHEKIQNCIARFRAEGHAAADVLAMDAILAEDPDFTVFSHLSSLRRALLSWYPFRKEDRALEIGAGYGALTGILAENCRQVDALEPDPDRAGVLRLRYAEIPNIRVLVNDLTGLPPEELYDLILLNDVLDHRNDNAGRLIHNAARLLAPGGTLLIGFRNADGIQYACGALDDHVIKAYRTDRLYTLQEIRDLAGRSFPNTRFYGILPNVYFPQAVYTDEFLPEYSIRDRVIPFDAFHSPLTANECDMYDRLVEDRSLPARANYILLECRSGASGRHVIHAALSPDRGAANSFATILYSDGTAEKKPLYPEGRKTLAAAAANLRKLAERGILTVPQKVLRDGSPEGSLSGPPAEAVGIRMPVIREPQLMDYLAASVKAGNRESFLSVFDLLRRDIARSSEPAGGSAGAEACFAPEVFEGRPLLREGFIDMIPYNAFFTSDGLRYYDQEYVLNNCPADYILFRAIRYTYIHIPEAEKLIALEEMRSLFGLASDVWNACLKKETDFINANRSAVLYPQCIPWAV